MRHHRVLSTHRWALRLAAFTLAAGCAGPGQGGSSTAGRIQGAERGTGGASSLGGFSSDALAGWTPIEPSPLQGRSHHSMVWTGKEMLVWGGFSVESGGSGRLADDGAAYDPANGEWRLLPPAPLTGRQSHFAFWTGAEMLLWGGPSATVLADPGTAVEHRDGALYDPARNRWRQIPDAPLSPRSEMAVAFAAGRLVVWGGRDARNPNGPGPADGAAYDPATDRWTPLAEGPLTGRIRPSVVSVGDRVLIWGGNRIEENGERTDGALYHPATDRWTPITPAPHADHCFDERCTGSWTGTSAVFLYSPLAYDPDRDRWSALAGCAAAQAYASGQSAAWTGDRLLVWGGRSLYGEPLPGAAYEPSSDRWTEIPDHPLFPSRIHHRAMWTGSHMIMWGGISGREGQSPTYHNDGAAYSSGMSGSSSPGRCRPAQPPEPPD